MQDEKDLTNVSATNGETTDTEFDPIQALNELKQNSVSRDEYNKVKAEKDKLMRSIFEGNPLDVKEEKLPADIDALRKDLFGGSKELTNLDFAKKSLELRDALIDRDGVDIFVANGEKIAGTDEDYIKAQRVADALQSCIDVADGNPEIFTRELMRITKDDAVSMINSKIRR